MLERLISLLAPHHCLVCDAEGELLCRACGRTAQVLPERCYTCRRLNPEGRTCSACSRRSRLTSVLAATEYAGAAKDLVWQCKFNHARAAIRPMAGLMRDRLVFDAEAILIHVPTATSRVRQRGYDQADLLARQVARQTGLRHETLLVRHGQSRQVGASRQERAEHLKDAFQVRRSDKVRGGHFVLVDDVLTTGATLEAAAKVLRDAGAKRVDAIVFAQA